MITLADSQAVLQSIVTGGGGRGADRYAGSPADLIRETGRFSAVSRMGVYRASYRSRLAECVRDFFPCLKFVLGDEVFNSLADEFLRSHPPSHPNLSRLADAFPGFLEATRSSFEDADDAQWPEFLMELANLELAFHEVYNAVGPELSRPFSLTAYAEGPEAVPADLRLAASPCLRLMSMQYPTAEFFTDFRTGTAPRFPTPGRTFAALSRRSFNVDVTPLSSEQHALLRCLTEGVPVQKCLFSSIAGGPEVNRDVVLSRWQWVQCWVEWRLLVGERADLVVPSQLP